MLNLVDHFGTSTIVFTLGFIEVVAVCWVYGVNRLCRDIEFMINHKPGLYWRLCWGVFTPLLMIIILAYTFISYTPLTYKGLPYPEWATSKFCSEFDGVQHSNVQNTPKSEVIVLNALISY